jgi:hypothetical protein
MPIRTSTIADRSSRERGRSAERIPTGIAIASQRRAPPKTSDAVTGAARRTTSLTSWRVANDVPSDWSITSRFMNFAYCT